MNSGMEVALRSVLKFYWYQIDLLGSALNMGIRTTARSSGIHIGNYTASQHRIPQPEHSPSWKQVEFPSMF